ncbi:MAG: sulfatase-like hydrolase/transferase [Rikenellaceae bacterium]
MRIIKPVFSCSNTALGLSIIALVSCTNEPEQDTELLIQQSENIISSTPNILFILADDLGIDAMGAYEYTGTSTVVKASTPNLDALQQQGIVFDNAWSSPLSSPTRAAAITGMYGCNSGVTSLGNSLSVDIPTLHASMPDEYTTAVIGKWHLSKQTVNPETYGIDYYAGMAASGGSVDDYYSWPLTEDLVEVTCTDYLTTKLTDLAIDWIASQDTPWLCWLTHVAPHTPYHLPPSYLHSQGDLPSDESTIDDNPLPYFLAMIESVDYEIGRLLESMDDSTRTNTVVIFMGDNGTSLKVIQAPYSKSQAKGSVYEGGVRVPLIVSGEVVALKNSRSDVLISAPDIFATTLELAGVEMSEYQDSFSYADVIKGTGTSKRQYSYTGVVSGAKPYTDAIRNKDYKLITVGGEPSELTKLENYTDISISLETELSDDEQNAYNELFSELQRMNISVD